ncbi:hypothetical protein EVAR_27491_1 [Eumeta japonica]|uniref:Uncharacterized protein n=1 Tax=Eumeta variegata TaxID=151549 RepID=A0A4C1XGN0_EUMVA|nr:hypothetical protein EVAR_27491_1 [Eumeta japonica]
MEEWSHIDMTRNKDLLVDCLVPFGLGPLSGRVIIGAVLGREGNRVTILAKKKISSGVFSEHDRPSVSRVSILNVESYSNYDAFGAKALAPRTRWHAFASFRANGRPYNNFIEPIGSHAFALINIPALGETRV